MAAGVFLMGFEYLPQIVSGLIIVLGGVFFIGGAAIVEKSEKEEG